MVEEKRRQCRLTRVCQRGYREFGKREERTALCTMTRPLRFEEGNISQEESGRSKGQKRGNVLPTLNIFEQQRLSYIDSLYGKTQQSSDHIQINATTWRCSPSCQSQDTAQMDETRQIEHCRCALAAWRRMSQHCNPRSAATTWRYCPYCQSQDTAQMDETRQS